MKIYVMIFTSVVMISSFTGMAMSDGLDSLIEVGRSQGEIAKAYAEETRTYENVKRAIQNGAIKKGMTAKAVLDKYYEPVVVVGEYGTDRKKWIYKPQTSDFFEGPRISLFFTKDGVLDEISQETA